MNLQSAETDDSFAAFPTPDRYQFAHKQWIPQTTSSLRPSCIDNIIGMIKHEHDDLCQTNQALTNTLQQLRQENDELFQMLQLKDNYLQAAQRRIEELKQEIDKSREVAGRVHDWEGRLAACEQHIPIFQQSFRKIVQSTRDSTPGVQAENETHVPRLRRSARSTNLRVNIPQSQLPQKPIQQSSAKETPRHGRQG